MSSARVAGQRKVYVGIILYCILLTVKSRSHKTWNPFFSAFRRLESRYPYRMKRGLDYEQDIVAEDECSMKEKAKKQNQ